MEPENTLFHQAEKITFLCKDNVEVDIDRSTAQLMPLIQDIIDSSIPTNLIPVQQFKAHTVKLLINIIKHVYTQAPILKYDPHFFEKTDTHPAFTLADIPYQLKQAINEKYHPIFALGTTNEHMDNTIQSIFAAISYFFYLSDRVITNPCVGDKSIADIGACSDQALFNETSTCKQLDIHHIKSIAGIHLLPSEITALRLKSNYITTIYPYAFTHFKNLIKLNLSNNQLTFLRSNTFAGLHALGFLDLSENRTLIIDDNAFAGLTALEKLYLQHNYLKDVPTLTCLHSLQHLDLKQNHIKRLKKHAFSGLSNLLSLNICYNRITSLHKHALRSLNSLEGLYLNSNRIPRIPDNLCRYLSNLRSFNLRSNRIEFLSKKSLRGLCQADYIDISSNNIEIIADHAFQDLSQVKTLYLESNRITTITKNTLVGLSKLNYLFLSENNITKIEDSALVDLPNLKHLFYGNYGDNKSPFKETNNKNT